MYQTKSIIAGIDFSPCSLNALKYATALCDHLGMSLVVVHGSITDSTMGIVGSPGEDPKDVMYNVVSKIREEFPKLELEESVVKATSTEAILWAAEKYTPWFTVVGTQGVHESGDIFIGETTGALIKFGRAPVLAIPSGTNFKPYRQILFAVKNPYVASKQVLDPFLALLESDGSNVDLLHVTRDSMPDLSRFPDPYLITPHTHTCHTAESDNIYQSVQNYLMERDADLLVVISRLRGFFEGIFAQSATSARMFNSRLPILVLHGGVRI